MQHTLLKSTIFCQAQEDKHSLFIGLKGIVPVLTFFLPSLLSAQVVRPIDTQYEQSQRQGGFDNDDTETTNVPEGIYAWTIDSRFGHIKPAVFDTIPHGFQNENATDGPTGLYNFTGNLGAPRIARLFSLQEVNMQQTPFIFNIPYDYFLTTPDKVPFTNTLSPFTNITYHSCGNKMNGEDRISALFAVNAGKRLGMGATADYAYGRGYYDAQSTALFNGTFFTSYIGTQYQLHAYVKRYFLKNRENGGIENDDYVNRPESFPTRYGTADMPVNLARAWNKTDGTEVFLNHRYSLGFTRYYDAKGNEVKKPVATQQQQQTEEKNADKSKLALPDSVSQRKVRMPRIPRNQKAENENIQDADSRDEMENDSLQLQTRFIPVTSFIHTFRLTGDTRKFQSHTRNTADNPGFFDEFFLPGDSAKDNTSHLGVENTVAVQLHEGFNPWMKAGLTLFGKHELARFKFRLPYAENILEPETYTENYFTVGAQLQSEQSPRLKLRLLGELRTTGSEWGEFNAEAEAALRIPMRKDSLHIELRGNIRNELPSFYYRHYHARNAWWDNDNIHKQLRSKAEATVRYRSTSLTATLEHINNYVYFQEKLTPTENTDGTRNYRHAATVAQAPEGVQLLSVTLRQPLQWGILHWDNELTWQTSTHQSVLPLPALNYYSNLYLLFRLARVLRTELGADMRYFTRYHAPVYSPIIGQYAVQDTNYYTSIGNYPIINAYANFHLKRTRFYIMASHINYKAGSGNPFLVPHYPLNRLTFRLGISWNFVN